MSTARSTRAARILTLSMVAALAPLHIVSPAGAREPAGSSVSDARSTLTVVKRPDLAAVNLPAFDAFEPAVADQLRDAFRAAAATAADPGAEDAAIAAIVGELARLLHAYELYDAAGPAYDIAAALDAQNAEWRYLRGHVAQGAGDLDAAIAAWDETRAMLDEVSRNDPRLLVHLGRAHQARGDLEAARTYLEGALAGAPELPAAMASLGEIALVKEDPEQAIVLLRKALDAVPAATRLNYALGMAYRKTGDLEAARRHLAARGPVGLTVPDPRLDALESLKTGERVHLLRGRQAFAAGRFQEAAAAFQTAADADPKSARARVNLAAALAQLGDVEAAAATLRAAIEIDPDSGTAHFNLGQLLARKAPDAALGHLRQAAALAPADGTIHRVLAEALRARGLEDEALTHFVEATSWSPEDEDAILGRAGLLVDLGRYAEATRGLSDAHQRMPWQGRLAAVLARLLAASPDPSVRNGERALTLASRVHGATGRPEHARLVGLALAELGRCDEAARVIAQVVDALPEDDRLRAALGAEGRSYVAGPPCRPPIDSSQR